MPTPGEMKLVYEQMKAEKTGQEGAIAPVPVSPAPDQPETSDIAVKQFVSEYFDFTDLSVPQRLARMSTAGAAILGNVATEAIWAAPSQFVWRMVRGDSLAENWAATKHELSAPTLRKLFHSAPFMSKELLVRAALDPDGFSQDVLSDAFMETIQHSPITWKEALNESEIPWVAAKPIYESLGLEFLYDIHTRNYMEANPSEGIATVGGVTQYLDQQRIEDRKNSSRMIVSHLPDNWMEREVTIPIIDKRMTIGEAMVEQAELEAEVQNEIRYLTGEVLVDPVLIDDLAGGPVINSLAKAGFAGVKYVPRAVRRASKLGRVWGKGADEVAEAVSDVGATTVSRLHLDKTDDVAFTEPIITNPPPEQRLALPPGESPRHGPLPQEMGQPEFVGGANATRKDIREIREVMAGAAGQSKLAEKIVELHDEARVLGNEQRKLAERMGRAASSGNMEEAMRLNEEWVNGATTKALEQVQAKLAKLEGVREARMQADRASKALRKGDRISRDALVDDVLNIPGGMQVEKMPDNLLTVDGASAQPLMPDHVFAGLYNQTFGGGRLIGDSNLQHSVHHMKPSQLWTALDEMDEPLASRTLLMRPHDLAPVDDGDFVVHYIRKAGVMTREADWDIQAVYRLGKHTEASPYVADYTLTPVVTQGGVPIRKFVSESLGQSERAARVVSKIQKLAEGTPMYHHTRLSNALGMLYDQKIKTRLHEAEPTVSFTRFDATGAERVRARPHEAELLPGKQAGPTTPDYFNFEFGGVRLVTTREALTEKYGKPKPYSWYSEAMGSDKARMFEAEERVGKDVNLDDILRVEIDPTEFAASTSEIREASYNLLDSVIKGFEDRGIPVEVRPLFLQNEIETFRPANHPKYYLEKLSKGEDTAEMANRTIRHVATTRPVERADGSIVPAADVAGQYVQSLADADRKSDYAGKHIEEKLGIMGGTDTPKYADADAVLESKFKQETGAVGDGWKMWVPDLKTVVLEGDGGGLPPSSTGMGGWIPNQRMLPPPSPASEFADLGWFHSMIDEPVDALSRIDHPNAARIWDRLTEGRYEKSMYLSEVQSKLENVEGLMRKASTNRTKLFRLLDTKPDTPEFVDMWKAAPQELKESYLQARRSLDEAWDMMVSRGVIDPDDAMSPGYLRGYAPHLFPEGSDVGMGAIPYGLHDVPLNGNVMLAHLKHRYGAPEYIEDAMLALRTYFVGVANKTFMEPMYDDILQLAGARVTLDPKTGKKIAGSAVPNFPQVGRKYVEDLVRELKGYPGTIESRVRHNLRMAAQPDAPPSMKAKAGAGKFAGTLANFTSNAMYRGLLMGSPHYWAQNFFTQGVLNPAAIHGPFWTMRGIARHADSAWSGLEPQPALLGGFHALFEDLPAISGVSRDLAQKLGEAEGIRQLSGLMKEIDKRAGVTQVETQMRGIAFHIGFGKKLQEFEVLNGIPTGTLNPDNIQDMLTPGQIRRAMLEGMKESDNVNFVYGVYGSNPTMRHFFGGKSLAVTFQFMSYYGKQLAFLERNSRVRQDPGLLFRYLETWGVMSRLLGIANISGEEFNIFNELGEMNERLVEHGDAPVGPVPQMLLSLWTATTSEDPDKSRRAWEELAQSSTKAVPLIQAVTTEYRAAQRGQTGLRFNTVTGEVMRPTQPSETLANVLGLTSQTEEDVRREEKALRRMNKARSEILFQLGRDGSKAIDEGNSDELDRVRRLAQRFGIEPTRSIDNRMERMMYSRLARMVEDTGGAWEIEMYVQGLIKEMPLLFDETQANRYLEYRKNKQGLERELGIDAETQEQRERIQRMRRVWRLMQLEKAGGKNVPRS